MIDVREFNFKKSLLKWLYGLTAAVIGGGASAVIAGFSVAVIDPKDFAMGTSRQIQLVLVTFFFNSLISMFMYLKQSPLPEIVWDGIDRRSGPRMVETKETVTERQIDPDTKTVEKEKTTLTTELEKENKNEKP